MTDYYGKTLHVVPFEVLFVGMKVMSVAYGGGEITKLEEKQEGWLDARVTIKWDNGAESARYQTMFDSFLVAEHTKTKRCHPPTLGAFRGSFFITNNRPPTEQEIFDAGMRAGREIQWNEKGLVPITKKED